MANGDEREEVSDRATGSVNREISNRLGSPGGSRTSLEHPPEVEVEGPHLVFGRVNREHERDAELFSLENLRRDVDRWERSLEQRQEQITLFFDEWRDGLMRIEEYKNMLVANYGQARLAVDSTIERANVTIRLRSAIARFVLGLLPGLKSATAAMTASEFFTDFQNLGRLSVTRDLANQALVNLQSRGLSRLSRSAAREGFDASLGQVAGTQTLPGQRSPTTPQFALRLSKTLSEARRGVSELAMISGEMASASYRQHVDEVARALRATRRPPRTLLQQARDLQRSEINWRSFDNHMRRFHSEFTRAWSRLENASRSWSARVIEILLWIVYIADLSDDQSLSVIDEGEIENRLLQLRIIGRNGGTSYMGLDFGAVTWLPDTVTARNMARNFSRPILRGLASFNNDPINFVLTLRPSQRT